MLKGHTKYKLSRHILSQNSNNKYFKVFMEMISIRMEFYLVDIFQCFNFAVSLLRLNFRWFRTFVTMGFLVFHVSLKLGCDKLQMSYNKRGNIYNILFCIIIYLLLYYYLSLLLLFCILHYYYYYYFTGVSKSFFKNFYCYSITVVCLFSPSLHPTPAEPTSLPHLTIFLIK